MLHTKRLISARKVFEAMAESYPLAYKRPQTLKNGHEW